MKEISRTRYNVFLLRSTSPVDSYLHVFSCGRSQDIATGMIMLLEACFLSGWCGSKKKVS
jgi:hypothetical protein